ncbi:hypothetical protein [Sphingomonas aerolata]|uniref:hypothetical protein n=1 Tax=Sphingomonas aerolata TaxID=185951 RepID=UPI002FE2E684
MSGRKRWTHLDQMVRSGMAETTPPNLFLGARSFFRTMQMLLPEVVAGSNVAAMSFYFLGGFVVELSLKAIVLAKNRDQDEIRRISHNLGAGLTAAEAAGFAPCDPKELMHIVTVLGKEHLAATFRYLPAADVITMPSPTRLTRVLEAHLDQIDGEYDLLAWSPERRWSPR